MHASSVFRLIIKLSLRLHVVPRFIHCGADLAAQRRKRRNACHCDQRCDQAIFDGGRGLVVTNKLLEKLHFRSPYVGVDREGPID